MPATFSLPLAMTGKELIAVTKAALPTANSRLFKINLGMILSRICFNVAKFYYI
jgi:hypothetical protein